MNTELMLKVANHIENLPTGEDPGKSFCMWNFELLKFDGHDGEICRSPACIAGWTCWLADGKLPETNDKLWAGDQNPIFFRARDLLGLSTRKADRLFLPKNARADCDIDLETLRNENRWYREDVLIKQFITAKRAAKVLRHLAITGKINWSIPNEKADLNI